MVFREVLMIRFVVTMLSLALTALAAAALWQHRRYLHARRVYVQDRQSVFHSDAVFHVVVFIELRADGDVFDGVRRLRTAAESGGAAEVVYAGKVAANARSSSQLLEEFGEQAQWDAIVVVQFESREAWERFAETDGWLRLRDTFKRVYVHGMKRAALQNLIVPQFFLFRRLQQLLTRAPAQYPFEPMPHAETEMPEDSPLAGLDRNRELGRDAIVIVNLTLPGTPDEQAADRDYVGQMMGLMAEVGNGPMHIGRAVKLEGEAEFDGVAIVYYPGVDYFKSMATSRFFQGIIDGKQLGDTQATITVPILDVL